MAITIKQNTGTPDGDEQIPTAGYTPSPEATPTKTSKNQQGVKRKLPSNIKIDEHTGKAVLKGFKQKPVTVLPAIKVTKSSLDKFSPEAVDGILAEVDLTNEFAPDNTVSLKGTPTTGTRSTKESADFRRMQVHRLALRGVPKQTIADHLGVSLGMIYDDLKTINSALREELRSMDYTMYIGMSIAFYEECRNIALRLATDTKEKSNGVKMQALRTAVASEDAKHSFLARVGLFKTVSPTDPFNAIQTGRQGSYSDENDLNFFMQSIASAVKGESLLSRVPQSETVDAGPGTD